MNISFRDSKVQFRNGRRGHIYRRYSQMLLVLMLFFFAAAFLFALLSSASTFSFVSPSWSARLHTDLHSPRSAACDSQLPAGRPVEGMSLLQTSLKRSLGRPTGLDPDSSSPYSRSLGIRPSSIQCTWPSHLSLRCLRRVNIEGISALSSTSLLETLSVHEMERMRRRHLIWKVFKRFSCPA